MRTPEKTLQPVRNTGGVALQAPVRTGFNQLAA